MYIIVIVIYALVVRVDCYKHFNWYVRNDIVNATNRGGAAFMDTIEFYNAVENDPQKHSFQIDSSNEEPTNVLRVDDPKFTTTLPPLKPYPALCEDLIPPDEVTLGNPPLPFKDRLLWVRQSWFHLKSMLLEFSAMGNYTFQGYILQIRYNDTPIGRFRLGGSRLPRGVQCPGGGPNNTVYFFREVTQRYRAIEWVPPSWFVGNKHHGTIHITVIHKRGNYWKLSNTTNKFPFFDMPRMRDAYFADRQFYRTLIPKFHVWYYSFMPRPELYTDFPLGTYRPRLREVLLASEHESRRMFKNVSKFPW